MISVALPRSNEPSEGRSGAASTTSQRGDRILVPNFSSMGSERGIPRKSLFFDNYLILFEFLLSFEACSLPAEAAAIIAKS
jgi:hypothetical protein